MSRPNALVIGGSSGLGLEIAKALAKTHCVTVTGRHDPNEKELRFHKLNITAQPESFEAAMSPIANSTPIDILVLAAGYYQEGTLSSLKADDVMTMINVGILAPTMIIRQVVKQQGTLPKLVVITSTSQLTPRLAEPVYCAVKAGIAMLAKSLSLDPNFGKVLVAAPGGMQTSFWRNSKTPEGALDPAVVAEQILGELENSFAFNQIRIPRDTGQVERLEFQS